MTASDEPNDQSASEGVAAEAAIPRGKLGDRLA